MIRKTAALPTAIDVDAARRRGGRRLAAVLTGVGLLVGAGPALAEARAPKTLSERQLRALETRLLGAGHAAEHSAQRRARPTRPARRRSIARARASVVGPASEIGAWEGGPQPILRSGQNRGIFGINVALLPTGKVLWYGYPKIPNGGTSTDGDEAWAVLWDPATRSFRDVPPPTNPKTGRPWNLFCSGISMLADGRVLVTGGVLQSWSGTGDPTKGESWKGLDKTFTFDPYTLRWQEHEPMRHGRYYPSQMRMPDGRTFILQGTDEFGYDQDNLDLELFDPAKPIGQEVDHFGTLPSWAHGDFYPHMFWMPSGRGMIAGPYREDSWFLQSGGIGGEALGMGFRAIDAADPAAVRTYGTAVLLPLDHDSTRGEVVQYGGANDLVAKPHRAVASAEAYHEATGSWSAQPATKVARAHHNTLLLPDGSMVSVGGGVGDEGTDNKRTFTAAHRQVELWDPATRQWRLGPSQAEGRAYHSTAALLPDGSVISAGDDVNGGYDRDSYEIYKPPYFFKGTRPTISSAPATADYRQTIVVGSPDADIARAVLVAPAAGTHAVDVNQRLVNLPAVRRGDGSGYDVSTPAGVDVAPPGHYMLFLIDTAGRPSIARWIRLVAGSGPSTGGSPTAPVQEPAPTGVTPPAGVPTGGDGADSPGRVVAVRAAVRTTRLAKVRRTGRIVVRVAADGAVRASLKGTLTRRLGGRSARRGTVARWNRSVRLSDAGTRTVALPLTRSQRRLMTRDVRLTVVLGIRNGAGEVVRRVNVRTRLR